MKFTKDRLMKISLTSIAVGLMFSLGADQFSRIVFSLSVSTALVTALCFLWSEE